MLKKLREGGRSLKIAQRGSETGGTKQQLQAHPNQSPNHPKNKNTQKKIKFFFFLKPLRLGGLNSITVAKNDW